MGVEERAERVRGLDAHWADTALDPAAVIDRVVRLHRGDDADLPEAHDILRAQMLAVLVAEAAVAGPVRPGDAVVDVEEDGVSAIADGVHGDLEARRIGVADPRAHVLFGVLQQTEIARRVGVRLEEIRGAGAHRAVHETLEAADAHPVVARAAGAHGLGHGAPALDRQVQRRAHGEAAGALEALETRQSAPGSGHVRRGGNPKGCRVTEPTGERRIGLLLSRVRNGPLDQAFRLVLEDAGGRAVAVAENLAARGGGGVARDPRGFQRRRVGEPLVPVEAIDPHRIVGSDRVDPGVPRQRRAAPQRVIPVATLDPFAGPEPGGVFLDAAHELLRRGGVPQVDRGQLEPAADEMGVTVGEARRNESAAGVDDPGATADVARQGRAVAYAENRPAANRHLPGLGVSGRQSRPDHPVGDEQIGLGAAGGTEADGEQGRNGQATRHTVPSSA